MGLSFGVPLALGLGAVLALPVLAHLARQIPRERQAFGAVLLLQRLMKRLRRRRRVKDAVLLLVRLLALAALILVAAQPEWTYSAAAPEYGGSGRVVLVVDRSPSMFLADGGRTLFDRARDAASQRLDSLPEGTQIALVAFDATAERLTPEFTTDRAAVSALLAGLERPGTGSQLGAALHEARMLLGASAGEVFVYTDEAGPALVDGAREELRRLVEKGSAVLPEPIHADPPRNVAVMDAAYGEGIEGGQVVVRVANFGPTEVESACSVTLPDGQEIPFFATVGAGAEVEERVTVPPEAGGGVGRAACEDADLPFDDARYFHLPRVGASRVLVVDGDPGDTPTRSEVYFLERALSPWGALRSGVKPDVTTPVGLSSLDPQSHRVVFLANVADPRPFGPKLVDFVRRGGSVFVAVGDNVTSDRYNDALGALLPAPLRKVRDLADPAEKGVPLELPDTQEPLFAPFSRGGRVSFGKVRAHRVLTLEPYTDSDDIRTLLRFEGGVPALVERKLGSGRLLLWTGTVDLGWGNLPLQAVFMPFVLRTVQYLGGDSGSAEGRFEGQVGEPVSIPLPGLAVEPEVIGPGNQPVRRQIVGSELRFTPEKPGAYSLVLENAPPLAWVAVNAPPGESDVRRYGSLARAEQELKPELFTRRVDLAPGLLVAGALLLLMQAALGVRGSAE
jgi:hypothetical protein